MIAEKIRSVRSALGVLAGQVSEEQWQLIKLSRRELSDAADTAEEMESRLRCPMPGDEPSPLGSVAAFVGLHIIPSPGEALLGSECLRDLLKSRMSPPTAENTGTPPEAAPGATSGVADGQA